MRKKSRKGKKRNVSKAQRYLEIVQQTEGKLNLMNSLASYSGTATAEWSDLARAAEKWRAQKFDTAGKVMLARSQSDEELTQALNIPNLKDSGMYSQNS